MSVENLDKIYDENYFNSQWPGHRYSFEAVSKTFLPMAKLFHHFLGIKSCIDLGCASGVLLSHLKDYGVSVLGVDASSYARELARDDMKNYILHTDIFDINPKNFRKYDLVFSADLAEHLGNVRQAIKFVKLLERLSAKLVVCIITCDYANRHLPVQPSGSGGDPTHGMYAGEMYWRELFAKHTRLIPCPELEWLFETTIKRPAFCFSASDLEYKVIYVGNDNFDSTKKYNILPLDIIVRK